MHFGNVYGDFASMAAGTCALSPNVRNQMFGDVENNTPEQEAEIEEWWGLVDLDPEMSGL